jgi:diacylglycerol kinase (ATP)
METQRFSIRSRIKSFSYAVAGFRQFLIREHNARIHLAATISVVVASFVFGVSRQETVALVLTVGLVWITEMLNTCLEKMADLISRLEHPEIKFIKDLAAGAVLIAAMVAVITGLIIFVPKCCALAHG